MKLRLSNIVYLTLPLLVGCVDDTALQITKQGEPVQLSHEERELRIATGVVMGRLRQIEEEGDWQSVQSLSPQIYQLATALLPGGAGGHQAHVSLSATPSHRELAPVKQVPVKQVPVKQVQGVQTLPVTPPHRGYSSTKPVQSTSAPSGIQPVREAQSIVLPDGQNRPATLQPASVKPEPALAKPPVLRAGRSLFLAAQLGSYRSSERAYAGWNELQTKAPVLIGHLRPRLESVDLGEKGVFYRLKAGPVQSLTDLNNLCQGLAAQGIPCARADFTGVDPG